MEEGGALKGGSFGGELTSPLFPKYVDYLSKQIKYKMPTREEHKK